jgi:predicted permease
LAGGAAGVFMAYQMSALAGRAILGLSPVWLQPAVDPRVLAFAATVSIASGVLFGVAPAMRLCRTDPADVLRGGRGEYSAHRARLQQSCVALQIALSIVLLVAAGLSTESVRRLQRVPLGFDPQNVLAFSVTMQGPQYDDAPQSRTRLATALLERLAKMPGVRVAGATSLPPLRCCSQWQLRLDGLPATADKLMVTGNSVTPGYFEAMGIPVVRGRSFRREDDEHASAAIVINETFASRYFPNGDALGRVIQDGDDHAIVVGVVSDIKQAGVLDAPEPQFYRPFTQKRNTTLTFAVRTVQNDPAALVAPIRRTLAEIDPRLPMFNVSTMRKRVDDALLARRTFELLMVTFGVIALVLACAGLFAVTSFFVAQRTRELGLRVALGAEPGRLVAVVLRGSAVVTIGGLLLGTVGALAAERLLSHTLYGISAIEPGVFAAIAPILAITSIVAVYGPARRATAADPMIALRAD